MNEYDVYIIECELDLTPAKRCPDYDDDCRFVKDHASCFAGGITFDKFCNSYETPMAEGYCPFLIGSEVA